MKPPMIVNWKSRDVAAAAPDGVPGIVLALVRRPEAYS